MTTSPKKKRRNSSDLMPVQDQWEPYDQNATVNAFPQDQYSDAYAQPAEAPAESPHQNFRGYTPVPPRFDPSTAPFQNESSSLHDALNPSALLAQLSPLAQPPQPLQQLSALSTPVLSLSNSLQPDSDGKGSQLPPPLFGQEFHGMSINTFDLFANHSHNSIPRPDHYAHLDFNNFSIPDFMMSPWEPRGGIIPDFQDSPLSTISQLNEDFSSASSTPFTIPSHISPLTSTLQFSPCTISAPQISPFTHEAQLSPVSSPNPETVVDLPNTDASLNSLLFSQPGTPTSGIISDSAASNETVNDVARRARKAIARKTKQPIIKAFSAARLSSLLPLGNEYVFEPSHRLVDMLTRSQARISDHMHAEGPNAGLQERLRAPAASAPPENYSNIAKKSIRVTKRLPINRTGALCPDVEGRGRWITSPHCYRVQRY